jgi:hypothetical protein
MSEKRYCECGCGGEIKTWHNGRISPFLRGHHMRKKGWTPPPTGKHYCKCGCGTEILPLKSGFVNKYIKGHHLKGADLSIEYRIERTRNRWGREPILSPYLKNVFVSYDNKIQRWTACTKSPNKKWKMSMHANAVYKEYFGNIPKGYVVHHKDGKHHSLHDDRPDNLMLLLDEWNLRFFPVLAKGFGVEEEVVTNCYVSIMDENLSKEEEFSRLCTMLIEETRRI